MNKHKKIKMILCLCLALVMLFSPVMDTAAHAVAIESWVIYSIITFMTAAGFTFIASGGIDAMYNTVKDKADEYDNIIDFYDILRANNIKLVPKPNQDPQLPPVYDLFFTAAAVQAMHDFLAWLANDSAWANTYEATSNTGTYTAIINGVETVFATSYGLTPTGTENLYYCEYPNGIIEMPIPYEEVPEETQLFPNGYLKFWSKRGKESKIYGLRKRPGSTTNSINTLYLQYADIHYTHDINLLNALTNAGITDPIPKIRALTLGYYDDADDTTSNFCWYVVMEDGRLYEAFRYSTIDEPADLVEYTSNVLIENNTEEIVLPEIPTVEQGFLMANVEIGDPSLEEWSDMIQQTFIDTGTMPYPDPQVYTDPDYQPAPTPVPTPNPSPEYEDVESLGLPALGDALMDKFPFCLPEDLGRLLNIFTAERQTPKWEVDLYEPLHGKIPMQGDTMLTIDLGEYEEIGQITRWASVIGFCLFLLVVTKEFITW